MKKIFAAVCLLACAFLFCACGSIFSADHYESYPFVEESGDRSDGDQEIRNYSALRAAILELIENHEEQGFFRFGSYSGSLIDDLAAVCVEIKNEDPLGAYAVEDIDYDTSRIVSYYTSEISISYKKTAEEIEQIRSVSGLGEFGSFIREIMAGYAEKSVVRVYSSVIDEQYIIELVEDIYYDEPLLSVVRPTVRVKAYPNDGAERIYEISLDYGYDAQTLSEMGARLSERVEEFSTGLGDGDTLALAMGCARQLAELDEEDGRKYSFAGTAYGTLIEGSNDAEGLAMAYKALCDELDIYCRVVRGQRSGENLSSHTWNIIGIGDDYYHVDISRFMEMIFLLSDEEMWSEYYWNRDDYPTCSGSLGPEEILEQNTKDKTENTGAEDDDTKINDENK